MSVSQATQTIPVTVEVPLHTLSVPLRAALLAASDDLARPVLTNVHMYWKGGIEPLVVEATDSYRLHQVKTTEWIKPDLPFDVLIPARWLRVTVNALAGDFRSAIRFQGTTVTVEGYGETRSYSLTKGQFPSTEQFVTPGEHHPEQGSAMTAQYLEGMFRAAALWPSHPIQFIVPDSAVAPRHIVIRPPGTLVTLVLMPVLMP